MDVKAYLGRTFSCGCGREHKTELKEIEIGTGAAEQLPLLITKYGFKHIFAVSDIHTRETCGREAVRLLHMAGVSVTEFCFPDEELKADEAALSRLLISMPDACDMILAVGSGTIQALCNYISVKTKRNYMVFATAPSTDGFSSNCASLIVNHRYVMYPAAVPLAIIADSHILAKAPLSMVNAGIGEVFGMYTSLMDWKLSHFVTGEYYCAFAEELLQNALKEVMAQADLLLGAEQVRGWKQTSQKLSELVSEETAVLIVEHLINALVMSGIAGSFVENSMPVSGSEHHISDYLERRFLDQGSKTVLYGTKVGFGTLCSLRLYDWLLSQDSPCFLKTIQEVSALGEDTGVNEPVAVTERLSRMQKKWIKIRKELIEMHPGTEKIKGIFAGLCTIYHPEQIGVSQALLHEVLTTAEELSDRYTIRQALSDMGQLAAAAESVGAAFIEDCVYREEQKRNIKHCLSRIKCFVLDMDGTIYLGKDLFPFTHSFLNKVKESGRSYCFFTNNSSTSQHHYMRKLEAMGIEVTKQQLMISTHVLFEFLKKIENGKTIYLLGTESLRQEFETAGFLLTDQKPDLVILGFDTSLTYETLTKACTFIRNGAGYYGINPDYNCPMEGGAYIPDCGSMAKLIEASTGEKTEFFGKPSRHTLAYILEQTGCREEELAIVGDRLYTDIAVAKDSAVTSILVLSGESTEEDLAYSPVQPTFVLPSIQEIIPFL